MATKALQVGDRVTVGQTELMGTVKFLGPTEFAAGDWLGIELDEQAGKNDGSVKGKRYFESKPEHGIFVRPTAATKEDFQEETPKKLEPVLSPSNRSSRSSGLAPPLEKPKRLSERSLDVQKAGVQLELAQAMEDHDVETIRRMLPVTSNLGVDQKEISAAKRILSFEVQQNLLEEVDAVRNMVSELAEAVAKVEERAAARNEAQNEANGAASVLQRIGPELERRVWLKLQPSIERLLQGFISKVKAPAKTGLEDFGFDDFDLNGDGYITREEFDQVRSRILKGEPLPTKDEVLLRRGCHLRASELGVLAALNRSCVSVFRLPRVALLSTGDELLELGQVPDESRGQIVDSNRPLLCAMVKELGAMVTDLGVVKDEVECVRATIADAFKFADVVITSGGVSRGNKDYIKEVLEELGELHFGEMCMKPGKPSTFATVKSAENQPRLFFGLPGNPVSCFVTFKLLAAPAILKLAGMGSLRSPVYPRVDAVLAQPVQMDPVRPEYHRARARWDSGRIVAESTGFQRSSRIASIAETNCLLEIPKASGTLAKGTVVKALLLGGLRPEAEGFPSAPQAQTALGSCKRRRVGLLLLDTAQSSKVTEVLRASLDGPELREERRPKEAEAVKKVVESWCQEKNGLDLVLVLGELGVGNKDAEVVDTLRNMVIAAENVADLILHEALKETPLAMLTCTVAGYRHSTLLATLPDAPGVGQICKLITSLP